MISKTINPLILVTLLITIFLIALQFLQEDFVFHHNLIQQGQWWRISSGNFVHSNIPHLLLNLTGLWILAFLFIDTLNAKTFILATLTMSIFVGLGLYYLDPELIKYYGFSGILYGLFLLGGTLTILDKDYFTGISVTLFIIGKLIWDLLYGGSASSEELIGIPVAVNAHLYGAIGAVFISILIIVANMVKTRKITSL